MPAWPRSAAGVWSVVGLLAISAYAAAAAWSASAATYEVWVALIVVPLLLLANLAVVVHLGRLEPHAWFVRLLVAAFLLKQVGAAGRYLMAFVLYDGTADASAYSREGARLAESYREGDFGVDIGRPFVGTGFVRVLTGAIYTVTGPSVFVAYAVYSILGFWGLYFLYRAFRVGVPDGDAKRYAVLVLLLPSMLFWPSGLGKEAWMTLAIGLTAYGAALLLSQQPRCWLPLSLGVLAGIAVRPHITAALVVALALAYLLGRRTRPATELTPVLKGAGIVLLLLGTAVVVRMAGDFLGVEDGSASGIDGAISDTAERTSTGDSQFDAPGVESPLDLPLAALSVLARPFPWEAGNAQALLASFEGVLVLGLLALSVPRLRGLPARLRRQPYLILCLAYAAMFVYAFSNFSNFGLLTRERVQVLPFVLVLLALPKPVPVTRPRRRHPVRETQEVP